eukprot:5502165-Pleurochrysis_carterae.AAC.1
MCLTCGCVLLACACVRLACTCVRPGCACVNLRKKSPAIVHCRTYLRACAQAHVPARFSAICLQVVRLCSLAPNVFCTHTRIGHVRAHNQHILHAH